MHHYSEELQLLDKLMLIIGDRLLGHSISSVPADQVTEAGI